MLQGGALDICTATFVENRVLVTAARCVTPLVGGQPAETGVDGEWAQASNMLPNITVWAGSSPTLTLIGTVTNYTWVYRSGVFGDNVAVLVVDQLPGLATRRQVYPLRTAGFSFPESGVLVGYGADNNNDPVGGVWPGSRVHRSADADVVEATEVFAYSGNCLKRKDGGALILQDLNGAISPKACFGSGDYGAAYLIASPTQPGVTELAAVAAQGDSFPCTAARTYMSSVVYRANWLDARVNYFAGSDFREVVCPSATPSVSPSSSVTPSSSASPSFSPSPSVIVEIIPPHETQWGVLISLGVSLFFFACGSALMGVHFWNKVRLGRQTAVSPADVKDPTLGDRLREKIEREEAAMRITPAPVVTKTAWEEAESRNQARLERRAAATASKHAKRRNREVLAAQRNKFAMKKRAGGLTGENNRLVRFGNEDMGRFQGTGEGFPHTIGHTVQEVEEPELSNSIAPHSLPYAPKFQGTGVMSEAAPAAPPLEP
jgi:hypothetical protein